MDTAYYDVYSYSLLCNSGKWATGREYQTKTRNTARRPTFSISFHNLWEALSSLIHNAERSSFISGVPTSKKGPHLSHLFFADESLMFCKENVVEWCRLMGLLEKYEKVFGQKLNQEKTSILFSRNTSSKRRQEIIQLSGLPATQRYDKYLGSQCLLENLE